MADFLVIAFEGIWAGIAILLLASYLSFTRMNSEVRRARLFVMASRIHRFLLAFTAGFFSLVVLFVPAFAGVAIPAAVSSLVVFFFLGAVLWGSLEILLIARPNLLGAGSPVLRRNGRGAP